MWSDGVTIWLVDDSDNKIFAYDLASGVRRHLSEIDSLSAAGNRNPTGLWSDGVTMWVGDYADDKIYAYDLATGARQRYLEFNTLAGAGNRGPKGLWSNGSTMWVADHLSNRVYTYKMPRTNALLRSLELTGINIRFSFGHLTYTRDVPNTTVSTTVAVGAVSTDSIVTIDPMDADVDADGHQIDLVEGANRVTVTVESSDGTVTETYTVVVNRASAVPWSALPDFKALASRNADTRAIWSDGDTMWVADHRDDKIYAYDLATMDRDSNKDINNLAAVGNRRAEGLWSDGVTIWASDYLRRKIFAYDLATGVRKSGSDINSLTPAGGNGHPKGLWSDGDTMWVSDHRDDKIYAYDLATDSRRPGSDISNLDSSGNENASGLWSDGVTMWVADNADGKIYAYDLATGVRQSRLEFDALSAGNRRPNGIWSNGNIMWVADDHQDRLYAYDMPANAVLRSLEFTGMNIGSFLPGKFDYTARVPSTTASTKVAAEALSTDGIVTIVPVDADDEADGYQINLESGDNTVTVTDGTDTATYTVVITRTNLATVSDDATLSALSLAGVDIGAFSSAVTSYTASVPNSVASTSVTAVGTDTNAKITIVPVDADDQLGGNQVDLAEGPNRVTVTVESSDGNVTEAYTVDVNRASVAAFGWSVVPDFKALASGNATSRAIWSDGETMWVTDLSGRLFAYVLSTMARDVDKDVATLAAAGNHSVNGLWSDGVTIWASDDTDDKVYAYDLATGVRRPGRDFDTLKAAGNSHPTGLWSDGDTMWVSDHGDDKVYAYGLADGARRSGRDIDDLGSSGNGRAAGLWSDGVTLWVADDVGKKIYAYDLATGARQSDLEFDTLDAAGNRSPKGIWSNGAIMWVIDNHDDRLYAYNMPTESLQ